MYAHGYQIYVKTIITCSILKTPKLERIQMSISSKIYFKKYGIFTQWNTVQQFKKDKKNCVNEFHKHNVKGKKPAQKGHIV